MPTLYRMFSAKEHLFVRALRHYAKTVAAAPVREFLAGRDIRDAVERVLDSALAQATQPGRSSGCLLVCAASHHAATLPGVRALRAGGLAEMERIVAARLTQAIDRGELNLHFAVGVRARLLIDLMQATALRARGGASRVELEPQMRAYARVVLA